MNIETNYKNKILNIKINGFLIKNKTNYFESEIIPILLTLKSKKVIINLINTKSVDEYGINSLIKIADLVNRFKGKLVLCNINNNIKDLFKESEIFDYCFKAKNEKTCIEVFNI